MNKLFTEIRKAIGQYLLSKAMDILPDCYFKNEYVKFLKQYLKYL